MFFSEKSFHEVTIIQISGKIRANSRDCNNKDAFCGKSYVENVTKVVKRVRAD